MALDPDQVPDVAQRILAMREREQVRLERISAYMRGYHDSVYVPHGAKNEYKWLLRRSVVNFLPLVVSVISENLHVDGYLPTNPEGEVSDPAVSGSNVAGPDPADPWSIFHANRMQARQHALHRTVAKYGVAYTVVLPGTMAGADGSTVPQPVIRPVSPRRITALYADDVDDEWPVFGFWTPAAGACTSLSTSSSTSSMRAVLLSTWLYSALGLTSRRRARLRMVSASGPCSASSSRAAASTRAWVRPARWPGLRRCCTLITVQCPAKLYSVQLTKLGGSDDQDRPVPFRPRRPPRRD